MISVKTHHSKEKGEMYGRNTNILTIYGSGEAVELKVTVHLDF